MIDKIMSAILMASIVFLPACMESAKGKRASAKSSKATNPNQKTPTALPTFKDGNTFIQNGAQVFTTVVNLDLTFSDTLYLRGKDIDSYIRSTSVQSIMCLSARFTDSSIGKISVIAAVPRSVYNFSTLTQEYYYALAPADLTTNQTFCQKTGLVNKLFDLYPSLTVKFNLGDICPSGSCLNSSYSSQGLELYSSNGVLLSQMATKQLIFNVNTHPVSNIPSGQTCTETSQCTAQGYDCCSVGQCVKDLTLRSGVDTASPEYTQALQDILNNPANIYLYPQYYFICSQPGSPVPTPTPTSNPTSDAVLRLKKLEDLYNCTHKIEGEYGVCTYREEKAQLNTFYPNDPSKIFPDDRSFVSTFTHLTVDPRTLVSIEQILYGEVVVFDYTAKTDAQLLPTEYEDALVRIEGLHNDDLDSTPQIKIKTKPATAVSDELVVRYKIDASCTPLNTLMAKCDKYYIQGQDNSGDTVATHRRGRVTDHYPDSNTFKIPYYANTSKSITVQVDGVLQKEGIDWELRIGSPSVIAFLPSTSLKVFKNQKVLISYFVDLMSGSTVVHNAMYSKLKALNEIKKICTCADLRCSIVPVKNVAGQITDYSCVYPDPDPVEPPMSQTIYLSSKTVPVRFFDGLGVSQKSVSANTQMQEGKEFKYRGGNLLNPNNGPDINNPSDTSDTYVGFNEIYGSLTYSNTSAKPAYEVAVKKGRTYDIYVDRGSFSNCLLCGNDYYSQLNKLFPLAQFGGGIAPLLSQTNRSEGSGVRADEMAFGRACLLPATMIPWTHGTESTEQEQRLNRMSAQHFLFANGYQHDWYGFDYGSVIGSFDGVQWFSIGSNRRIKADTNKLFIAVNGIFGDLTTESTYEVTINDGTLNPASTAPISDEASDGAQCQQYHKCSTDNDCAATLGWDYACAPINEITTSWPKFDDNAKEIPETSREDNRLTSILKITSTGKRCVYRGRAGLCTPNYASVNVNATFNQSTNKSFHACSANNYCQPIAPFGNPATKFNNRLARYGKVRVDSTVDSFGMGAPLAGRPYAYVGAEAIRPQALKNLNANKAQAMCLPGREVEVDTFVGQNQTTPTSGEFGGDKILGIGMTFRKNTSSAAANYLMSCSITDSTGNFYQTSTNYDPTSANSSSTTLKYDSGTQAVSTNALNIFNSIFSSKGITFGLYKNNDDLLTSLAFTENRCMRAPGASCFTDQDCAPSKAIADKIRSLNPDDTTVSSVLNKYEVKFWQEELICSQAIDKAQSLYDPKNNRCCRALGKTISLPSADITNQLNMTKVPGIDVDMKTNNRYRYTRAATLYKDTKTSPATYPELRTAIKDQCTATPGNTTCASTSTLRYQYATFAAFAERTSCTGDWVRTFNGGTHKWESTRFQSFNPLTFRCFNWFPGDGGGFTCAGMEDDDPDCPLIQTSPNTFKAKGVFDYLARLELMGIPQIALEAYPVFNGITEKAMSCLSNPTDRTAAYPGHPSTPGANYLPPPTLFKSTGTIYEYSDGQVTPTFYYSGLDETNFSGMKKIFSSDEVVACLPAGTQMKTGDDPNLCCTGLINSSNNKCQLADYIDVSVYTNRYVSSEAKKLNATLFDANGYLKDPAYAAALACEKKMCASGTLAYGVLISKLKTPGQTDSEAKHFRFLEGSTQADNPNGLLDLFNKGLKLNTHAYCIPAALAGQVSDDLTIVNCGN